MDFRMISWFGVGEREVTGHLQGENTDVFYYRQSQRDIERGTQLSVDQLLAGGGLLVEFEGQRIRSVRFNAKKGSEPQQALLIPVIGNERFIDLDSSATVTSGAYLIVPTSSSSLDLLRKFVESCNGLPPDQRQNVLHSLRQPGFEARLLRVEKMLGPNGRPGKSSIQGRLAGFELWHLLVASFAALVIGVFGGMFVHRWFSPSGPNPNSAATADAATTPATQPGTPPPPVPAPVKYGPTSLEERNDIAGLLDAMDQSEYGKTLSTPLTAWRDPKAGVKDQDVKSLITTIDTVEAAWARGIPDRNVKKALVLWWCALDIKDSCEVQERLAGSQEPNLGKPNKDELEQKVQERLQTLTDFAPKLSPPRRRSAAASGTPK